jgi:hypothetical protein
MAGKLHRYATQRLRKINGYLCRRRRVHIFVNDAKPPDFLEGKPMPRGTRLPLPFVPYCRCLSIQRPLVHNCNFRPGADGACSVRMSAGLEQALLPRRLILHGEIGWRDAFAANLLAVGSRR